MAKKPEQENENSTEAVINPRGTMLNESRFKLAEYERSIYIANCDEKTALEDLTDPKYWALLAPRLKPFDLIEARADDGSWIANLIVMSCERNWAKVKILQKFDLTEGELEYESKDHLVAFKGPQHKWSVIRTKDGEYIKDGFASRLEADQHLIIFESNIS